MWAPKFIALTTRDTFFRTIALHIHTQLAGINIPCEVQQRRAAYLICTSITPNCMRLWAVSV